ncbi:hypothetical protein BDF19DRAFT_450050 [Syncephalis fuscata]|nr:hypothetical protein BDF19DRAFT_450050 [Syncephalis fuscata]
MGLFNIYFDPLGEINFKQTLINSVLLVIFTRNLWRAFKLVYHSSTSISSWCCFLQALMGVINSSICILSIFPHGPTCRHSVWSAAFGMGFSSTCPSTIVVAWLFTTVENTVDEACIVNIPNYYPWLRLSTDLSSNLVLSVLFLRVVIKLYFKMGSKCWERLKSDGFLYTFGVIISNILCAIFTVMQFGGRLSEMMFLCDWLITSVLLIYQHEGMRKAFSNHSNKTTFKSFPYKVK